MIKRIFIAIFIIASPVASCAVKTIFDELPIIKLGGISSFSNMLGGGRPPKKKGSNNPQGRAKSKGNTISELSQKNSI